VRRGFEWLPALFLSVLVHAAVAAWIEHSAPALDPVQPMVRPIKISLGVTSSPRGPALAPDSPTEPPGQSPTQPSVAENSALAERSKNTGAAAIQARDKAAADERTGADAAGPRLADPLDRMDTRPAPALDPDPDADRGKKRPSPSPAPSYPDDVPAFDRAVAVSIPEPVGDDAVQDRTAAVRPSAAVASTRGSNSKAGASAAKPAPVSLSAGDAAADSREARQGRRAEYALAVQSRLAAHRSYPRQAQRRGEEGTALLFFALDRHGRVVESRIDRSTGHARLDDEALAMVERAQPFPPLPTELVQSRLELIVPLRFELR